MTFAQILTVLRQSMAIGSRAQVCRYMLGAVPANYGSTAFFFEAEEFQLAACLAIQQIGE